MLKGRKGNKTLVTLVGYIIDIKDLDYKEHNSKSIK